MRLKDRVSIITGGGGGIGRSTAIMFAKESSKVVIADQNEITGAQNCTTHSGA